MHSEVFRDYVEIPIAKRHFGLKLFLSAYKVLTS